MLWLADVLTGTRSQQWDKRYRAPEAVEKASGRSRWQRISGASRGAWGYLYDWVQRRRARHALSQLSDHLLRDLGIERADIAEFVRNDGLVSRTESTSSHQTRVGQSNPRFVPAGGPGRGQSSGQSSRPLVQQCNVRTEALSCANDPIKHVA